jgi:hypothetical protein
MTNERFNSIVEGQLETAKTLLISKGEEYSLTDDRLAAFKKAASLQGETTVQALCGMLAKHIVSIYDMGMSDRDFSIARWDEKITDSINYLLLLKAAVEEDKSERCVRWESKI